jgi:hypothetical protein
MAGEGFSAWIGRTEEAVELVAPAPLRRLAALLDHETPPWPEGETGIRSGEGSCRRLRCRGGCGRGDG